ncbi:MAG TPA: SOS response-associated peptidase [Polyangiales bacterium]
MCGRFFRNTPREEIAAAFHARWTGDEDPLGYNIAPSQLILAVRLDTKHNERLLSPLHWGLIPHFAKDRQIAWRLINARAETVDKQSSYRDAFTLHRCIVPLDGFFEWKTMGKVKQPYAFALESRKPMGIAGLWSNWKDPASGEWVRSCTLITTQANEVVRAIHDRMPVVLEPADYARWLGEESASPGELKAMLRPFDASPMVSWPVSRAINKPGGDDDASVLARVDVRSRGEREDDGGPERV